MGERHLAATAAGEVIVDHDAVVDQSLAGTARWSPSGPAATPIFAAIRRRQARGASSRSGAAVSFPAVRRPAASAGGAAGGCRGAGGRGGRGRRWARGHGGCRWRAGPARWSLVVGEVVPGGVDAAGIGEVPLVCLDDPFVRTEASEWVVLRSLLVDTAVLPFTRRQ
jgi:hypothetical protein